MSIKVKLDDLKRAIALIESEGKETVVTLKIDGNQLHMHTFDRRECELEVVLYESTVDFLPKVKKTDLLR
jgi:hypothetical protein